MGGAFYQNQKKHRKIPVLFIVSNVLSDYLKEQSLIRIF